MLFIFRKLRRSFFLPGKVRTYVAYAIGEIALIMAGILLALQVSEWNQARKDRIEERQILIDLQEEFQANRDQLVEVGASWAEIATALDQLLSYVGTQPKEDELPKVRLLVEDLYWRSFDPRSGSLKSTLSSGNLALIRDSQLRSQLSYWPDLVSDLDYNFDEQISYFLPLQHSLFETRISMRSDSPLSSDLNTLFADVATENWLHSQKTAWLFTLEEKDAILEATDEILRLIKLSL
jgi:hypothetical protein